MIEIKDYDIPKLPESIIDDSLVRESKRNVNSAVKALHEAWEHLMTMQDMKWHVPAPKEITLEWLDSEVERRTKGLKKLPYVWEEKQQFLAQWNKLAEKAKPDIRVIEGFFEQFPNADVTSNDKHQLSVNNVEELVNEGIVIHIPEEAQEYFDMFCKMRRAIKEFRDFEESHGYKTIPLCDMLSKFSSPKEFAFIYAIGGMKVSTSKYADKDAYKFQQIQCRHAEGRDYDY